MPPRQPIEPMPQPRSGPSKKTLAGIMGATAAAAMTAGLALWEGDEEVGYFDIARIPTACRGITGPDIVVGRRYSPAECERLNERGAIAHIEPVLRCTPSIRDKPYTLAAAGMLAYNIGPRGYCNSTAAKRFNAGNYRGGCDAFLSWNKARVNGQLRVVRGLNNRRIYERSLCLRGLA